MLYNKSPTMWRSKMRKTMWDRACPMWDRDGPGSDRTRFLRCAVWPSLLQRRSTPRHPSRQQAWTPCISETPSSGSASLTRTPRRCFRRTLRASSGETTSLADASEPSMSTSGSTSRTRSSGTARCGACKSPRRPSSRIPSRRACASRSGRHAWRVSSAGRLLLLRDLCPQEGEDREGSQVDSSHVGPQEGCVDMTREAKARARQTST
jgi:hypothetical protein